MDDFEQKLKRDAAKLPAEITPELEARLRASLAAQAPPRAARKPAIPRRGWLAAGLTGAAAAVLTIALLPREPQPPPQPVAVAPAARTAPEHAATLDHTLPLPVEPPDLTAPLEQELANLRADLEQARRRVADDMAF
ncbi:MAG TPA: hypothetical protein VFG91_10075 [Woeseiaceae bacterium]|nr:hypothetical protein [Woeseiaceae bacterium]